MNKDVKELIDQLDTRKVKCNYSDKCNRTCSGIHFIAHDKRKVCESAFCEIVRMNDKKEVKVKCVPV